jgi:hypothetical protein
MERLGVEHFPPAGSSSRLRIDHEEGGVRADRRDEGVDSSLEVGKQGNGDWSDDKQLDPSGEEDRAVPLSCSGPLSRSGVRLSGNDRLFRRRAGAGANISFWIRSVSGLRTACNSRKCPGMLDKNVRGSFWVRAKVRRQCQGQEYI